MVSFYFCYPADVFLKAPSLPGIGILLLLSFFFSCSIWLKVKHFCWLFQRTIFTFIDFIHRGSVFCCIDCCSYLLFLPSSSSHGKEQTLSNFRLTCKSPVFRIASQSVILKQDSGCVPQSEQVWRVLVCQAWQGQPEMRGGRKGLCAPMSGSKKRSLEKKTE